MFLCYKRFGFAVEVDLFNASLDTVKSVAPIH